MYVKRDGFYIDIVKFSCIDEDLLRTLDLSAFGVLDVCSHVADFNMY